MRANLLLSFSITTLISVSALLSYVLQTHGFSATTLLIMLVAAALIAHIFTLFKRQQKQAEMVIRALANGDSTLGLGQQRPLQPSRP